MSSSHRITWRLLLHTLDRHPKIESAVEILFNAMVSFAPFVLVSLYESGRSTDSKTFWLNFHSYFSGGELVLFIFSACASIAWIYFFKPKDRGTFTKVFILLILILPILYCSLVLSDNIGFNSEISQFSRSTIWTIYFVVLLSWFWLNISHTEGKTPQERLRELDRRYGIREES